MSRATRIALVLEERFRLMHRLIDSPPLDLPLENWSDLYELTLAFRPDLILELGRGYGNSTCVFTEAANAFGCRVVSVGFDSEHAWETRSAPRLEDIVDADWFAPLTVLHEDITTLDFHGLLAGSERALVFWDAHGADVAQAVLGSLFPTLPAANRVVVDDIWAVPNRYGFEAEHRGGPLGSSFDEIVPLWEYLSERQIEFEVGDRWISFTAREG
jgi:cephalosporin hydroxylase